MVDSAILSKALTGSLFLAFLIYSIGFFSNSWIVSDIIDANIGLFRSCILGMCANSGDYPKKAAVLAFLFISFVAGLAGLSLSALNEYQKLSRAKMLYNAILSCILAAVITAITGFIFFRVYTQDVFVIPGTTGISTGWSQYLFIVSLALYAGAGVINILAWRSS
jgi:hypothetical protein